MKARSIAVCLALTLAFPVAARAGDPPTKAATQEGRERFKRGVDLFHDGDFRAALIEFNRANEVAPSHKIQFNIAQTCLELQDYACALRAFENYLGEGGKEVPKDRQQLTEREIARLKRLVGSVRVISNKDGAEVSIDDIVVGRTPLTDALLVGAGRHKVSVSLPPFPPTMRVVDVAGGDKLDVEMALSEPVPVAPPPALETQARAPEPAGPAPATTPAPSRAPFWIGLVTTGVLAAGTGVTGALALSAQSKLDKTTARLGATPDDVASSRTSVRTLGSVTDVLLVTTIVAAGITTVLFFTTSPAARSTGRARGARWATSGTAFDF